MTYITREDYYNRQKTPYDNNPTVVAVYFQNGLGNFICLTPAIQALAELYQSKVDVILDKEWNDSRTDGIKEFCEHWPIIDNVVIFQDGFKKEKYKIMFYSRHGEASETFEYFRIHSTMEPKHVNWRAEKLHEVDYYMNEVRELGYMGQTPKQYCIPGTFAGTSCTTDILRPNEYLRIGICNGFFSGSAKWKWERKGWPYFEELVELIQDYYSGRLTLFLFGKGEVEKEWAEKVVGKRKNVVSFVDKLDLCATIQIMRRMHLFITTDTGLMHVADALGKSTIALFGPTLLSKNAPLGDTTRVLRSTINCSPCQQSPYFNTCKEWRCMAGLTPDIVMAELRLALWNLVAERKLMTRKGGEEVKSCLL